MTLQLSESHHTQGAFHLTTHDNPPCIVLRMDRVMYDLPSITRCVDNLRALADWLEEQGRRDLFRGEVP